MTAGICEEGGMETQSASCLQYVWECVKGKGCCCCYSQWISPWPGSVNKAKQRRDLQPFKRQLKRGMGDCDPDQAAQNTPTTWLLLLFRCFRSFKLGWLGNATR